jgi:hypothetical protein
MLVTLAYAAGSGFNFVSSVDEDPPFFIRFLSVALELMEGLLVLT